LKSAALGTLGIAGLGMTLPNDGTVTKKTKVRTRSEKLTSMASNSYAVNALFKRRSMGQRPERQEITDLKKKYRELTLLDFPQFSKETYPGVTKMDLWPSLFGDVSDDSMFVRIEREGQVRMGERELADYGAKAGVKVTIENHWGLAADPVNIIIILNEVNNPFCEA